METAQKTNVIIENFLQRLSDKDADGIAALFAEDIDWYVPGNPQLPWIGARCHRRDVGSYFRTMWPYFEDGKSIVTLGSVVVSGNEVVIFARFQHTVISTGKTYQTPVALHLLLNIGKISSLHLYEDTWTVSQAFSGKDF